MKLSYYTNIIKLKEDKYLLLKPFSRPIVVDNEVVDSLNGNSISDNKLADILNKENFTTQLEKEEEIALLWSFLEKQKTGGRYSIALTYDCNFRCIYCYEKNVKNNITMTKKMVDKFIDILLKDEIKGSIGITGGEPLLEENRDILKYLFQKGDGLKFDIISNGYELSNFIDLLSNYNITSIKGSLDGPKEIHDKRRVHYSGRDTFDVIIRGIKEALDVGLKIVIYVNVDSQNIDKIEELTQYLKENNIETPILLKRVNDRSGFKYPYILTPEEYFAKIFQLLKKESLDIYIYEFEALLKNLFKSLRDGSILIPKLRYCGGCEPNVLIFDPMGDIYCCDYILGNEEYKIGTYYPKFEFNNNYYLWKNRTASKIKECYDCKLAPLCGGGCALEAKNRDGTIYKSYCKETEPLIDYLPIWYSNIKIKEKITLMEE